MRKLIYGIVILILVAILGWKFASDIQAKIDHNRMNIDQVNSCSEYLRHNPDGICD